MEGEPAQFVLVTVYKGANDQNTYCIDVMGSEPLLCKASVQQWCGSGKGFSKFKGHN